MQFAKLFSCQKLLRAGATCGLLILGGALLQDIGQAQPRRSLPRLNPPPSLRRNFPTSDLNLEMPAELAIAIDNSELLVGPAAQAIEARPRDFARLARPNSSLQRELADIWIVQLPSTQSPSDLNIRYEVRSPRGQLNQLSHSSVPSSTIQARMRPLPPQVSRERGSVIVRGRALLELNLAPVRYAGNYQGTVVVTVEQL